MKIWMGFTSTDGSLLSWAIRRVTGGKWSHGFIAVGENEPEDYYEAHAFSGSGKGFRGPKVFAKIIAWAACKGNVYELIDVTGVLPPDGPDRVLQWCEDEVKKHRRGYDIWQLLRMWVQRRLLWRWFDVKSDPDKVVCSEAQTRAMLAAGVDLCKYAQRSSPDDMSPVDVYLACICLTSECNK